MRRLLFFLLFVSAMLAGVLLNHASRFRDVYRTVCNLAEDHFYKADYKLEAWVRRCRVNAARVPLWTNEKALLGLIQDQLNEMQTSHFNIYDPGEDKALWTGEAIDTGIRARYVEDSLVIYRVIPESAADDVDVRVGDEVLGIQGTEQVTPWGAANRAGLFHLRRKGNEFDVVVEPRTITPDLSPSVKPLDARTALLTIPSFRSNFFDKDAWNKVVVKFQSYPHVIVDIRENTGGNVVAMMRSLSTFMCAGHKAGVAMQPRKQLPDLEMIEDDMLDSRQIELLDQYRSIGLKTYPGYGCYKGRVTVLISSDTASVSEIFAHSFFKRPGARVWGQPSAGDVILAVWYDLPKLGPGFSVSIPEAIFLTPDNKELENQGVYPQKELYYDLKDALAGRDTWLEAARK
jgi:carboxyl-terminal processing protease